MDAKLQLVLLPVTDVDRAKAFYEDQCDFELNVDSTPIAEMRVVQLTPKGSACSIGFGTGITDAAPGSVVGLHLVVQDVVAAQKELSERGVATTDVRHMSESGWTPGAHPERADYYTYSDFADPDGNKWVLQEVGHKE